MFVVPNCLISSDNLPTGDTQRILSATFTGIRPVDAPYDSSHLQKIFDLKSAASYFVVPSVFMSTG